MKALKRRLYRRGSSFETTVPMPLLFGLSENKKYDVLFELDQGKNLWFIHFEERQEKQEKQKKQKKK